MARWLGAGGLVAGGWWLVAGGWWLVAGGWWLVAGGWWLNQQNSKIYMGGDDFLILTKINFAIPPLYF